MPFLFSPLAPFGKTVHGEYVEYIDAPTGMLMAEVDTQSGEIVHERRLRHPSELGYETDCQKGLANGVLNPMGRLAATTCEQELVLWGPDDKMVVFKDPTYVTELPSDEEVEEYRRGMERAFGMPLSAEQVALFAETPKRATIGGGARSLRFDAWGRLWAGAYRGGFSYLNLYSDTTHVGGVRVRHRIRGFDLSDSTLAVLVERPTTLSSVDGLPKRGIDWYRIQK